MHGNMMRSLTSLLRRPALRRTATATVPSMSTKHAFHGTRISNHGYAASEVDDSTAINMTFVDRDGLAHRIKAPPGRSLLEVAHANDIDLEGACEGSLACSTCHVYLDERSFNSLEEPCDDENDMLDLAFGLSEQYVFPSLPNICCKTRFPLTVQYYLFNIPFTTPRTQNSSRLGCQIKASGELEGMQITLPPATRNMAVDGFVPQPH